MTKVTRRNVLKGGSALVGGMAGILATGRPPAFAQGATVHWLRWNDFVPASDQLLRKELLPAAEKALGIKVNFETVNGNDLQPRITSAIQSGSGPDVIMLFNNHPQIYSESVVDMSELATTRPPFSTAARSQTSTKRVAIPIGSSTVMSRLTVAPYNASAARIVLRRSTSAAAGVP